MLEAGYRSGSLNTAGHAAALGRPLGAVPGPVTSPASAGCHRLLREYDAICVTDAEQMAELVGGGPRSAASERRSPGSVSESADRGDRGARGAAASPETVRVLDALSTRSPRELSDIARRCGMTPSAVMGVLGGLEAVGHVKRHPFGWLRVARS